MLWSHCNRPDFVDLTTIRCRCGALWQTAEPLHWQAKTQLYLLCSEGPHFILCHGSETKKLSARRPWNRRLQRAVRLPMVSDVRLLSGLLSQTLPKLWLDAIWEQRILNSRQRAKLAPAAGQAGMCRPHALLSWHQFERTAHRHLKDIMSRRQDRGPAGCGPVILGSDRVTLDGSSALGRDKGGRPVTCRSLACFSIRDSPLPELLSRSAQYNDRKSATPQNE